MRANRVRSSLPLLVAVLLATPPTAARAQPTDSTPSVELTSTPPPGDVSGGVALEATGEGSGGRGAQMHLVADGRDFDFQNCSTDPCVADFRWGPKPGGTHTVQAVLYAKDGQVAKSQTLSFRLFTGTHVSGIQVFPNDPAGGTKRVTVFVYDNSRNSGAENAPVTVTLTPAVGRPTTRSGAAGADGSLAFDYTFTYNTTIAVVGGGNDRWGRSTRSKTFTFVPSWSCSLAHPKIAHGHPDKIACKVPGLPAGTKVDLAYADGAKWVALAKGQSGSGKLTLAFTPKKKGKLLLRVKTKGARVYRDSSTTTTVTVT